jgi:hypothetical protein
MSALSDGTIRQISSVIREEDKLRGDMLNGQPVREGVMTVHVSRLCDVLVGANLAAFAILGLTFIPGVEIRGQHPEPCGKSAERLDGHGIAFEQPEPGGSKRAEQAGQFDPVGHAPILTSSRGVSIE